ncbi:hypothetical protein Tco_0159241 [Tanacetum coccineum]
MFFSLSPTPCGGRDLLLGEIDTLLFHFNDSSPDYETFCFDIEEKSSGSTTSHSYHSLPEYESFCFDLPPADRSDFYHKELADELAHIISPSEYDHFYFDLGDNPGELTRLLKKNISETLTKDLKINELNDFLLFLSDCDSIFSEKFFEIDLLVLFPSGNKDKVFDPGIFTINGVHSKRFSILLLDDFSSILFVIDFLFLTDPSKIETFLSFPSGNEDKGFHMILKSSCLVFNSPSKWSSDHFHYFIMIPSDESKVHIEVLLVLWGNRLPIPDGSLPLSRYKGLKTKQKRRLSVKI